MGFVPMDSATRVALGTFIETMFAAHADKYQQAKMRPSLRNWFVSRAMLMTGGRLERDEVYGAVHSAFIEEDNTQ